jgi:hypothetical protein
LEVAEVVVGKVEGWVLGVGDSVGGSEASLLGSCDGWELGKLLGPGDSSIRELAATTASELVK